MPVQLAAIRAALVLFAAFVIAATGVIAPARAAIEDAHHGTLHEASGAGHSEHVTTDDDSTASTGSAEHEHPDNAAHSHCAGIHIHSLAPGVRIPAMLAIVGRKLAPLAESATTSADLAGPFHPPRA